MTAPNNAAGFFIAGTDTGVGKTVVACALAAGLRRRGFDVGVMKPVETGIVTTTSSMPKNAGQGRAATNPGPAQARPGGTAGLVDQRDSVSLRAAAQVDDPLDLISPLQFALPAAPNVAAKFEKRRIDLPPVLNAFAELQKRHAVLLVESAGGLLSPFDDTRSMADLARVLHLPVLLVTRAALGAIHHTRLCLEAARARELCVAGVVVSHTHAPFALGEAENLAFLREELGELLWGEIPFAGATARSAQSSSESKREGSPAVMNYAKLDSGFFWDRILAALPDPAPKI